MHILQKSRKTLTTLLASALCCGVLVGVTAPARAAEILPQEVYVGETRASTCTLLSSTMLIRSTLYLNGNSHWNEVDEYDVESVAWLSGAGLLFSWTFQTDYASISVNQTPLYGVTVDQLKALLDAHPEGIVFYCGNCPHAVFLTDYEGDTFYCSDPATYIAGSRIPLDASWLGECYGHDQATILANATAYWAVTSCAVDADQSVVPLDQLQTAETAAEQPKPSVRQQLVNDALLISDRIQATTV